MKMPLLLTLGVLLLAGGVKAQEPTISEAPAREVALAPEDAKSFDEAKEVVKLTQLWTKPLDWNETGSSTADIVAHLKKALGAGAPTIEVRGKDTNRSTFVMKAAPLGPTLSAVADLANMSVWVFPSRLLLAPEAALTSAERSAVKEGTGGEWKNSAAAQGKLWDPNSTMQKIGVSIVGAEVKARLANKGTTAPTEQTPPTEQPAGGTPLLQAPRLAYELTFGELSPSAQAVLQDMFSLRAGSRLNPSAPKVESSAIVSFDDTRPYRTELRLQNPKADAPLGRQELARWSVNKPLPALP